MKIALITACLAGVAHSKMAALALKKEAKKRGHNISIEEQGGHKIPVKLSKEERQEKMSKNRQSPNPNKTERERKNHFSKLYQNKKTKTLRTNKNDKERTKSRGVLTFRVLPSMYLPLRDLIVTLFYTLFYFLHPLSFQRPHSK